VLLVVGVRGSEGNGTLAADSLNAPAQTATALSVVSPLFSSQRTPYARPSFLCKEYTHPFHILCAMAPRRTTASHLRRAPYPVNPSLSCPLCPSRDPFRNRSGLTQHWNSRHASEGPIVGQPSARRPLQHDDQREQDMAIFEQAVVDGLAELNFDHTAGGADDSGGSTTSSDNSEESTTIHPSVNGGSRSSILGAVLTLFSC
jgi:hypothetical protein